MADDAQFDSVPIAIEAVVQRLQELEVVIGPQAAPVVAAVRSQLINAMAARDRGDRAAATQSIADAMNRLAGLADSLDADEAAMMRLLAQSFSAALRRGDTTQAKQQAAQMFEKSGAAERKKN
jgi:hypothetical protein